MRTQFIPGAIFCNNVCKKSGIEIAFKNLSPAAQKAMEALREGCDEDHLAELIGNEELEHLYYYVEELRKHGFLQYRTVFLDMLPLNADFSIQNFVDVPYRLSRFTLCRFWDGKWGIENPLSSAMGFLSEEGVQLLHALCKPTCLGKLSCKFPQIPPHEIEDTLSLLLAAQMIVTSEEESSSMAQWEFHDLFHTRSRHGRVSAPYGGTFRFRGIFPSEPSTKKCLSTLLIPLARPEKELELTLEQTMAKRRSIREHGREPMNLRQLGEFLWRCGRVKECNYLNDEELTSRPYPGGGARYELEIYPVIYQCEGLDAGVYHYHPGEHQLCRISDLNPLAEQLLSDARKCCAGKKEYPQVLLQISARFQRVSWKYQSLAYALILKNLGVLIQTMYLVATASDLAPCAIGGGNSDLFCKVIGTNYLEETSVGEFMLGSLP